MYFNNIPQGFGIAPQQDPDELMQTPVLGYNQGIGGLQPQQNQGPAQPAPQLGNLGGGTATTAGLGGKSITPLMPYSKPQAGQTMAKGGVVKQTLAKGGVVAEGIAALRGQHPNPREALDAYDRMFGPDATAELMRGYADGGVVSGPGSGVADLVPGSIDGREDVRIASGEYVIPAWAVAALGDGSTEAGAKVLDAMVARLREAGSELIMGTEPIEPNEFLPV
jgi:hypothetical protein